MKKLFLIMLIALMCSLGYQNISAAEEHVVLEDYELFMTTEQYRQLNEDLEHIAKDYDIGIYFIYDTSIDDSETAVKKYADDFIQSHSDRSTNAAIVMNDSYYYVAASGEVAGEIIKRDDAIFDRFYSRATALSDRDPNAFYEGIVDAYQYIVEIVNQKAYQSEAPVSTVKALVNDFSDILSDSEEEKLNRRLQKIKEKYGFDAVVVTTDSFNGMSAGDYADDFYDYSQYSKDGILFILNMSERTWYVSTKGKAIDYFTDYGIDQIFEEMSDELSRGRYYNAFVIYGDQVEEYIINGNKGDIIDTNNTKTKEKFGIVNVVISMFFGAISSLITSVILKGKMKNVSRQRSAGNYVVSNSFHVNGASDMLVNRHVSRTHRPRQDNSFRNQGPGRPQGGGSSIHTSSSGSSHGGHGGHF
jgi:uncharacterized protein